MARRAGPFADPTLCPVCRAVFHHKAWHRARVVAPRLLGDAASAACPACRQVRDGRFFGRVVVRGAWTAAHEDELLRRVANVSARARFNQPERRLVEIHRDREGLEVRTTSQRLAHRIARELRKAFGGEAWYSWSDRDRGLRARWQRD